MKNHNETGHGDGQPSPPVTLTIDTVGGMAGPQIPQNSGGNKDSVAVEIIGESNGDRSNRRARSLANLEATKFKKGQSGNPAGRPKTKIVRKSLLKHLRLPVASNTKQLDCIVDSTIQTAIEGGSAGVAAFTAIRDTVDGRPSAADDGNGGPTNITIEMIMVGGQ